MHKQQTTARRRRRNKGTAQTIMAAIIACMAIACLFLLTGVDGSSTTMQLTLVYSPTSDSYDLQGSSDLSWQGTTTSAPEGSPARSRMPDAMRVNALPSGSVLQQGVFFLPAAATVAVPLYAQTTIANLSSAAQLNATNTMGALNYTHDQVSILSVDANGQPNVWALKLWSMRPQLSFVSTSLSCEQALIGARNSTFACGSIVPLVSTAATGSEAYTVAARISSLVTGGGVDDDPESTRAGLTLQLNFLSVSGNALPELTEPFFAELLAMMYAKARVLGNQQNSMQALRRSANERRSGARIAVAFMWTWIMVTAGFSVFVAAVWLTWAFPYVGNRCMHTGSIALTILTFACLFTLVGILEGLAGFLVIFLLMLLTTAFIGLAYCCLRARHRDRDLHRSIVGDSLTDRDYVMTTGDVGHKHPAELPLSDDEPAHLINNAATNLLEAEQAAAVEKQKSWHAARLNSGLKVDDDRTPLTGGGGHGSLSPMETAPVQTIRSPFNRYPDSLGSRQRCYMGWGAMLFLVGAVVCTAIFGLWDVNEYKIWHRDQSSSVVEFMPQAIAKATFLIYAYDGFANRIQMNQIFFDVSTQWCGSYYSTHLDTDAQRHASIQKAFIEKYSIDMRLYKKSSYADFSTVNEWFIRELVDGTRPIAAPEDPTLITQPADARMMAFPHMPADSFVWIKDRGYTVAGLIGSAAFDAHPGFDGGSMALVRLAPQDYHRFHVGFSGVIVSIVTLEGSFHSVNADGMTSQNYAIYNQRMVVVVDTDGSGGSQVGRVAYVAIGALCVGSITILPAVGSAVSKGDCLGYFQFGGSTVALVFEQGRIRFDQDLVENSANKVETYVQMGSTLGRATTP